MWRPRRKCQKNVGKWQGSRARTCDLRFWRPPLYQLSYTPSARRFSHNQGALSSGSSDDQAIFAGIGSPGIARGGAVAPFELTARIMIQSLDEFVALIQRYDAVALIGNSEGLDIDAVVAAVPENTLFVFFTGCAKVLRGPFPRDAMMCHRLIKGGSAFLKSQRTFDEAYSFFPAGLKAEVGILADKAPPPPSPSHRHTAPECADDRDARLRPCARLVLSGRPNADDRLRRAMWILGEIPDAKLWLCGFTGSPAWSFTSTPSTTGPSSRRRCSSSCGRAGSLVRRGAAAWRPDRITQRFPEFRQDEVALVAAEVLARRFTGMERQMAKLWTLTKVPRKIRSFLKRFRRS